MTDRQKRVLQFGLKSQKFGACTVYNIAGSIVEFQGGTVQCKNDFLKLLHIAHTAAFKLGGLFDILAWFSISRVNL